MLSQVNGGASCARSVGDRKGASVAESRLTYNTHETSLGEILRGRSYFHIPPFQRAYKWQKRHLEQLIEDINRLNDEEEGAHFIGAIIVDELPKDPSGPSIYEIIDGQQRVTTFYLLIAAAVLSLLDAEESEAVEAAQAAEEFAVEFLFTRQVSQHLKASLLPSIPDQFALRAVLEELLSAGLKQVMSAFAIENLPNVEDGSSKTSRIKPNFATLKKHFVKLRKEAGVSGVKKFVHAAQLRLNVVQIVVKDPTSGPKIFDSLNSKQEPMTTGDLVRNEIFRKVAREDLGRAKALNRDSWLPFYNSFVRNEINAFEGFFFPFGLIQDEKSRKSDVFLSLRKQWDQMSPEDILQELEAYRLEYQDLEFGENNLCAPEEYASSVLRLNRLGFPRVALPFLMRVSHSVRVQEFDVATGVQLLSAVEAFLVRRALCSLEPTGLHAVFKRLWNDLEGVYTGENLKRAIKSGATISSPSDPDVRESFKVGLYRKSISRFVVYEFDASRGGDLGQYETMWIEHILPQTYHKKNWPQFTPDEHKQLVHLAGNLIPLSKKMNGDVGQKSFSDKRLIYGQDSGFKSAREVHDQHEQWTVESILERTQGFADWAIARWVF